MQRWAKPISLIAVLVAFVPVSARAQAFELNGGYSTMFQAQGASLRVESGESQGWIGGGIVQHRFRLGAYGQTQIRQFTIGAGDDATEFKLPTDIFTGGQYVCRRGLSVGYKGDGTTLSMFGGTSSLAFGAPYFRAAEADRGLAMISLDREISPTLHLFSRNVFSRTETIITGVEWQTLPWLRTALAGGLGGNEPYGSANVDAKWERLELQAAYAKAAESFLRVVQTAPETSAVNGPNAQITFKPLQRLELSAGHVEFLQTASGPVQSLSAKVNRGTMSVHVERFRIGAGVFETTVGAARGTSENLWLTRPITRRIEATANLYRSHAAGNTANSQSLVLRESLHPRLKLLQLISRSNGQYSASFGGEFISNPVRFGVDYQNVYVPFDVAHPLRQAISVNGEFHLIHGFGLQLASFVDSTGKTRYTISAKQFLYRGPGKPAPSAGEVKFGKYIVRGHVVDENGRAVAGAAIYIDGKLALTDPDGRFFVRFTRPNSQAVRVAVDEFIQPGYWQVMKAPLTAAPKAEDESPEIEIVVRHLSPQAKRLRDSQNADVPAAGSTNDDRIHRQ